MAEGKQMANQRVKTGGRDSAGSAGCGRRDHDDEKRQPKSEIAEVEGQRNDGTTGEGQFSSGIGQDVRKISNRKLYTLLILWQLQTLATFLIK